MSDTDNTAPSAPSGTTRTMPRAVHEIVTGKKPEDIIDAGTLITDSIAKEHKLSDAAIDRLIGTGAIEDVEVLTA